MSRMEVWSTLNTCKKFSCFIMLTKPEPARQITAEGENISQHYCNVKNKNE